MNLFQQFRNEDVSVIVSELLIATADSSDPLIDGSINELLRTQRERLKMDVVFVSEITEGKRVFRFVDTGPNAPPVHAGHENPVEESYCQRVIDGRLPGLIHDAASLPAGQTPKLPIRMGAHLSTPIVLDDGRTYGTLCCFSSNANPQLREADLANLRHCATLVARKLEHVAAKGGDTSASSIWDVAQSAAMPPAKRPASAQRPAY